MEVGTHTRKVMAMKSEMMGETIMMTRKFCDPLPVINHTSRERGGGGRERALE